MLGCIFGIHRRRYVGVVKVERKDPYPGYCPHHEQWISCCGTCRSSSQVARWVCACGAMGERYIRMKDGVFMVRFGELVPDEKTWGNFT